MEADKDKREDVETGINIEENGEDADGLDGSQVEDSSGESKEKSAEEIIGEYEQKLKEMDDRYLRLAAEFDNYKKRNARLYETMVQAARESIILPILEVVDNYERALESADNSEFESLLEGTKLIHQQLTELLQKEGIEPIKAIGEEFDPNLHEAMMQIESDEYPEGVIAQEVRRGYRLNGKVVRHSRVAVSKGKKSGDATSSDIFDDE